MKLFLCTMFAVLSACSHEFVVLERHLPDDVVTPSDGGMTDASIIEDAGVSVDARLPRIDSSIARDAGSDAEVVGARVVSGFAQTCAVLDGALWCWGADDFGQVGVIGEVNQTAPVRLAQEQFIDVCAGERHSCALRADGTTLCWGSNSHGQLGLGDLNSREVPTPLNSRRFLALSCGGFNTCAIAARGELWCWGDNSEGKLAQNDPAADQMGTLPLSSTPIPLQTNLRFTRVSVGQGHVCAISDDGRLHCWGRNNVGQLGISEALDQTRTPGDVASNKKFVEIAAGQRHSCAVDVEGKLSCWGQNNDGLLGIGGDPPIMRTPAQLGEDSDWDTVTANWLHSCASKRDGTLYCWGRAEQGQLGGGGSMIRTAPARVGRDNDWRSVTAGQFHTCAFADDGLYCWGANDTGQLGLGNNARFYVPVRVNFP